MAVLNHVAGRQCERRSYCGSGLLLLFVFLFLLSVDLGPIAGIVPLLLRCFGRYNVGAVVVACASNR